MKILLYALFSISALTADIIPVDSLSVFEKDLLAKDGNALILFDVDCTLVVPDDAALRHCQIPLMENFLKKFSPLQGAIQWSRIWMQSATSLVDDRWPLCITQLQSSGIPTLAFTAAPGGNVGLISSLADSRIEELLKFGVDFSKTLPHVEFLEFPKDSDKQHPPLFKSGILFSSTHPKGDILRQFLDAIRWYPSHVVLIDDRIESLESVERALNAMRIPFTGYHYLAVEKLPINLDHEVAEYQFRHLEEQEIWLSDADARDAMKQAVHK